MQGFSSSAQLRESRLLDTLDANIIECADICIVACSVGWLMITTTADDITGVGGTGIFIVAGEYSPERQLPPAQVRSRYRHYRLRTEVCCLYFHSRYLAYMYRWYGLLSLHVMTVVPAHCPPILVISSACISIVAWTSMVTKTQPSPSTQVPVVHGLSSMHVSGVPTHEPKTHWSPPVQHPHPSRWRYSKYGHSLVLGRRYHRYTDYHRRN